MILRADILDKHSAHHRPSNFSRHSAGGAPPDGTPAGGWRGSKRGARMRGYVMSERRRSRAPVEFDMSVRMKRPTVVAGSRPRLRPIGVIRSTLKTRRDAPR